MNVFLNNKDIINYVFKLNSVDNPFEFLNYLPVCKRWNEIGQKILSQLWDSLKLHATKEDKLNILHYINQLDRDEKLLTGIKLIGKKFRELAYLLHNCSEMKVLNKNLPVVIEDFHFIAERKALEIVWKNDLKEQWSYELMESPELDATAGQIEEYIAVEKNGTYKFDFQELNLVVFPPCLLNSCQNLTMINLANNALSELPFIELKQLTYLNLKNNKFTAINLTGFPSLETLHMGKNSLDGIDVSKNPKMKYLTLNNNHLRTIDLEPLEQLTHADLRNNPLESFDCEKYGSIALFDEPKEDPAPYCIIF
jgi:Leucine-rich repeat (LRR) protein